MPKIRINQNWQDTMLGGTILAGFVVIAIIAALFAVFTWSSDDLRTPSTHASSSK